MRTIIFQKIYNVLDNYKRLTCPKVDDEIEEEDCVRHCVEDDPLGAEFIVKEGDGNGKDDEVSDEHDEHE